VKEFLHLCTENCISWIYGLFFENVHDTPPNSKIICGQNVGTKVVFGIIIFFEKKAMLKI
jgi:hypothetical protein